MKATALPVIAACAVLGWLLPPLWMAKVSPPPRHRIAPRAVERGPAAVLAAQVRSAGSGMAQLRAVVAGVTGHGSSLATLPNAFSRLAFDEARELAIRLAGAEISQSMTDRASFYALLKNTDWSLRNAVLESWAERDPDAALDAALNPPEAVPNPNDFRDARDDGMVSRLVERDPERALRLLQSPGHAFVATGWPSVLTALAKKDPETAFDALQTAPPGIHKSGLAAILSALAEKDPQAALAWADSLSPEWKKKADLIPVFYQWAETDPRAAFEARNAYQDALTPELPGFFIAKDFFAGWARKNPEEALRWASVGKDWKTDCPDPAGCIDAGIKALAESDPPRAAAVIKDLIVPPLLQYWRQRWDGLATAAVAWGATDLPEAFTWARTLEGEDRSTVLRALAPLAGQLPADEVLAVAKETGLDTASGFGLLWKVDHAEALSRLAAMTLDNRQQVMKGLTADTLLQEPEAGMKLLRTAMGSESSDGISDDLLQGFIAGWVRMDSAAAAAAVDKLPPGGGKTVAVRNLVSTWSHFDPGAAAVWTRALPSGPVRDSALTELTGSAVLAGDPAGAFRWAAAMEDATKRQEALAGRYAAWSAADPAAATAALEALPAEAGDKKRIMERPAKNGDENEAPADPFLNSKPDEPAVNPDTK